MEEGYSTSNPRKRCRTDAKSTPLLNAPSDIDLSNTARVASHTSQPLTGDAMLSNSNENPAPVLQPLHPPIPNFSAISQGAPRPQQHPVGENNGGMIYNIALPLPNPGRAHRFCQACEHINHVRRKLCENCGAPKPSAVRNAVGVRNASDNDNSQGRIRGNEEYVPDGYYQRQARPQSYTQASVQAGHALPSADLRGQKSSDPVPHQAHSLAMRCPGDDIPLLGNNQRMQQPHYNLQDPATSTQRFRMPPTVLSQPLISFNGLNSRDGKTRPLSSRPLFGNVADANHRTFPGVSADRDQYTLPSMHGVPGQAALQSTIPNQRTDARPQVSDPVQARPGLEFQGRTQEAMPEDVVALNRGGGVIQDLDGRHGTNTYSQWGGTRAMRPTSGNTYSDTLDSQAPQHIAYGNSQDFFVQQHTFRTDDRNTTTAGLKYNGVHNSVHNDKGYPDTQPIMTPGHSATAGLGAFMDPNSAQAQYRQQNAKPRAAPIGSDGRMSLMQVGALHPVREVDEAPAHLGESNRPSDDGRFTIENILMQHKNGAQNQ